MRARAAGADGAAALAAQNYAQALQGMPDNDMIARRAYREALAAGDFDLARRALAVLQASDSAPPDATLVRIADLVHQGNSAMARRELAKIDDGPLEFLQPTIAAWLTDDDAHGDPLASLDRAQTALARRLASENRGLLMIAHGDIQGGIQAIAVITSDKDNVDLRIAAAQLLIGLDHDDLAQTVLGGDGAIYGKLKATGGVKPSAAFGIGYVYESIADELHSDSILPLTIALSRSALLLDPNNDHARITLADALSRVGDFDAAQQALKAVTTTSPFHHAARETEIAVLGRAGRKQEAITVAGALASEPGATPDDIRTLGDLQMAGQAYHEAAQTYGRAIAAAGSDASWAMYLQQGGALERAGDWAAAEPLLRHALQLAPDDPVVLNYLGYALIERGQDMAAGQKMIERADRMKPNDPSITDSLGWAYYRRGDAQKAIPLLEAAVRAKPGDTTLNNHLGDAYWAVGRYYEARYAWRAAAVFAEGQEADTIRDKIEFGLKTGQD